MRATLVLAPSTIDSSYGPDDTGLICGSRADYPDLLRDIPRGRRPSELDRTSPRQYDHPVESEELMSDTGDEDG